MVDKQNDRLRLATGWTIGLFTFLIYNATRAATLSFWDCGEFIACAKILGIPHPPGTPLFVLVARVFTVLPLSADVAARVNVISTLTSAGAAMLAFFVLYRIIHGALDDTRAGSWKRPVCYIGAVCGSLFMAFSNTHWNNAVETEVYGPSMFIIMAVLWLVLRWMDTREAGKGDKYLIAIAYTGFASIGFHLTAFMVMPSIFLFIVLIDKQLRTDWRFWVTGLVLLTVAASFELFGVSILLWLAIVTIAVIRSKAKKSWVLILLLVGASIAGYSNHLYIPIRSAHDPNIDENNPETFESFRYYLGRKQYGSENMVTRMFHRRGNPANQFGDHARMGFWRFFKIQYGFNGAWFLPFFALGIFGCLWLWARNKNFGTLLGSLLLVGSVGLVLYMNFADGTRYDPLTGDAYIEVRDRDYFFTPGYIVFGMMMGVGLAGLLALLFGRLKNGVSNRTAWVGLLLVLLPLYSLRANYVSCDRSRDYTPWDYAYNILNFCERDAILFTSGDNDTFPVWCLQDAYGIRRDVGVINLSLANTDWYILQMRDVWGLPVTWTDAQIRWTVPTEITDRTGKRHQMLRPAERYLDPMTNTQEFLFPRLNQLTGGTLRVQDMVVEHVLQNNRWRRPVYFSGTVGDKSRWELDKHYVQQGILYKVVPYEAAGTFDPDTNAVLFADTCRYRGVGDPTIFRSESTVGNWMIYPEKFLQLSDVYSRRGDTVRAIDWAHRAAMQFPQYWRGFTAEATLWRLQGDSAAADSVLLAGVGTLEYMMDIDPENRYYQLSYGMLTEQLGRTDLAREYLERAFYSNPSDPIGYQPLLLFYRDYGLNEPAVAACRKWLEYFPDDELARQIITVGRVR
jgi:hypothetical protein